MFSHFRAQIGSESDVGRIAQDHRPAILDSLSPVCGQKATSRHQIQRRCVPPCDLQGFRRDIRTNSACFPMVVQKGQKQTATSTSQVEHLGRSKRGREVQGCCNEGLAFGAWVEDVGSEHEWQTVELAQSLDSRKGLAVASTHDSVDEPLFVYARHQRCTMRQNPLLFSMCSPAQQESCFSSWRRNLCFTQPRSRVATQFLRFPHFLQVFLQTGVPVFFLHGACFSFRLCLGVRLGFLPSGRALSEFRFSIRAHERDNQCIQGLGRQNLLQFVQGQADAVIGNATLRKVVCTNAV